MVDIKLFNIKKISSLIEMDILSMTINKLSLMYKSV